MSADSGGSGAKSSAGDYASAPEAATPSGAAPNAAALRALPRLTTAEFGRDVARLMRTPYGSLDTRSQSGATPSDSPQQLDDLVQGYLAPAAPPVTTSPAPSSGEVGRDGDATCTGPTVPDAVSEPATLDGALVALVFRPPTADAQLVEAWSCDGRDLLVSVTVPKPVAAGK